MLVVALAGVYFAVDAKMARSNEEVAVRVDFWRPVANGCIVKGARGAHKRFISIQGRTRIAGFAPDFSAWYWTEIDHARSGDRLRVIVKLKKLPQLEVYAAPWVASVSARPTPARIDWASRDGTSFFVNVGSDVVQWSLCDGQPRRVWSESNVRAFASSSRFRFLLSEDNPRELRVYSLGTRNQAAESRVALPVAPDRLIVGNRETEVIGTRYRDSTRQAVAEVVTIDTTHSNARLLTLPSSSGEMIGLVPMRGTSLILAEVWRGEERQDGSELTEFITWEPPSGKTSTIFRNDEALQVHELPPNVVSVPALCKE
jgi:hypothetical protein